MAPDPEPVSRIVPRVLREIIRRWEEANAPANATTQDLSLGNQRPDDGDSSQLQGQGAGVSSFPAPDNLDNPKARTLVGDGNDRF